VRPIAGRQPTTGDTMNSSQFIRIPAERNTEQKYEAIINHHLINFVIPSNSGQVGKSIITLARGPEKKNIVATMYDLDTLAAKISHLTPVQVYSTGMGSPAGAGLVNLSRVIQITEYQGFLNLEFVDGDYINVTNRLV
jgi:hypothetical protein